LADLEKIDWSKKDPDRENVCIVANSVVSNRQARAATKAYIKAKLEMELTEAEQRSLDRQAVHEAAQLSRSERLLQELGFPSESPKT
jgi:DNA sulfur modification protein DndB